MSAKFVGMIIALLVLATSSVSMAAPNKPIHPSALRVQEGSYDVVVLAEEMGPNLRQQVQAFLAKEHGKNTLTWTVPEADGLQFVFAYPYEEVVGEANAKTQTVREELRKLITESASASEVGVNEYVCNRMYRYAYWTGSQFMICGNTGGSHGYGRLADYGFDNIISSYFEDRTQCAIDIYDGNYYSYYMTTVLGDWGYFSSDVDNKTSSIYGYY